MNVLSPDTGSFNKLLVWSGFACVVLAFAIPWLFLREVTVIEISKTKLADLTPRAQQLIRDRQEKIRWIERHWWVPSAVLLPSGIILLGVGGFRLYRQQVAQDARFEEERAKIRGETPNLKPQSAEEQDLGAEREVEEATRPVAVTPAPATAVATASGAPQVGSDHLTVTLSRDRYRQLEEETIARVRELTPPDAQFASYVKTGDDRHRHLLLDAVITSPWRDILVDVRVAPSYDHAAERLREIVLEAISRTSSYTSQTGRSALTWLIVVIDNDEEESPVRLRLALERVTLDIVNSLVTVQVVHSPTEVSAIPSFPVLVPDNWRTPTDDAGG